MRLTNRVKHFAKELLFGTVWRMLPASYRATFEARRRPYYFPKHIFIEPSTRCNLKCLHCGRTHWRERDQERDLDFELFKRSVDQLKEVGSTAITLQGLGEPLMHKDIFEMIEYAQAQGFYTRFNTNFTIFNEEMAERLVRSGHSEIMVSFESIDPELYADIRRGAKLADVLRNIEILTETKKRLGMDKPTIFASVVLLQASRNEVPNLVRQLHDIGVESVNFQGLNTDGIPEKVHLKNGSRIVDNSLSALPSEEIERITAQIEELADSEVGITVKGDLGGRGSQHTVKTGVRTCKELWTEPYIDSAGKVTPCCFLPDGSLMEMGDLHNNSFEEIWLGNGYETLRKQHLTNQHPKYCRNCQQLNHVVALPPRLSAPSDDTVIYDEVFLTTDNRRGEYVEEPHQ